MVILFSAARRRQQDEVVFVQTGTCCQTQSTVAFVDRRFNTVSYSMIHTDTAVNSMTRRQEMPRDAKKA